MKTKICKICKRELPETAKYFNKGYVTKKREQRYSTYCKECQKKLTSEWHKKDYKKNRNKYLKKGAEWRNQNRIKNEQGNINAPQFKRCTKCNKIKLITEFNKDCTSKDGYCHICKTCRFIKNSEYYKKYPNKQKEYYKKNLIKIKEYQKQYRVKNKKPLKTKICPICGKEFTPLESNGQKYCELKGACYKKAQNKQRTQLRKKNRAKYNAQAREWKKKNSDKVKEWHRQDRINNRDRINKNRRKREKQRRRTDIVFKLKQRVKSSIHLSLKYGKDYKSSEDILGYTIKDLKRHLELQFKDGMSWDNYGRNNGHKGWEIDHIIPQSFFEFKTYEDVEFKLCWNLGNLQPMWGEENISKFDKLDYNLIKNIRLINE